MDIEWMKDWVNESEGVLTELLFRGNLNDYQLTDSSISKYGYTVSSITNNESIPFSIL